MITCGLGLQQTIYNVIKIEMTTLNKMVLLIKEIKKIKMIKMIKMINDYDDYLGSLHLITSTSVMVSPLEK